MADGEGQVEEGEGQMAEGEGHMAAGTCHVAEGLSERATEGQRAPCVRLGTVPALITSISNRPALSDRATRTGSAGQFSA